MAKVPVLVIGLPVILKILGTVAATDVTPVAAGLAQVGAPTPALVRTWLAVPTPNICVVPLADW